MRFVPVLTSFAPRQRRVVWSQVVQQQWIWLRVLGSLTSPSYMTSEPVAILTRVSSVQPRLTRSCRKRPWVVARRR